MRGNLGCVERSLRRALAKLEEARSIQLNMISGCVNEAQMNVELAIEDLDRAIRIEEATEKHEHG